MKAGNFRKMEKGFLCIVRNVLGPCVRITWQIFKKVWEMHAQNEVS